MARSSLRAVLGASLACSGALLAHALPACAPTTTGTDVEVADSGHDPDAGARSDGGPDGDDDADAGADGGASDAGVVVDDAGIAGGTDGGAPMAERAPVLMVHGINGSSADFDTMRGRLEADGWPAASLLSRTFEDPSWGCNVDNATTIDGWVDELRAATGAVRVHIVAHSMGTLSSRYFVKNLGGTDVVQTYVTLGGQHHGLSSPCGGTGFSWSPCVWEELCEDGEFIAQLNEDPATPGPVAWVSIRGSDDEDTPAASAQLDGALNIEMPGVTHDGPTGLQEDLATYQEIVRVLSSP